MLARIFGLVENKRVCPQNQITVLDIVDMLAQPSIAVKVLVCERSQLLLITGPLLNVSVGVPHASEAVAPPSAADMSAGSGSTPRFTVE